MTGGLSNFGIVTGCDFSGGRTKLPFAAAAASAGFGAVVPFVPGAGEAFAVESGVGVTAGGGAVIV
jgi:hypothetical protein